jgi:(4S)-4-hydroxy-5-phosphonooxypentane-2,3-dione isomerase
MYVVCVPIRINPGMSEAFLELIRQNHEGSVKEPGCLRFDVLRQAVPVEEGQPEGFFLYEVYKSEDDFKAHQQTAHYFTFREAVEPFQYEPRKSTRYHSVFPEPWS